MCLINKHQYISVFLQVKAWKGWIFQIIDGPFKSCYEEEDKVGSCWNRAGLRVFWTLSGDVETRKAWVVLPSQTLVSCPLGGTHGTQNRNCPGGTAPILPWLHRALVFPL